MKLETKFQGECRFLLCVVVLTLGSSFTAAEERPALDNDVHSAIAMLLETSPAAKALAPNARGALIFPNIVKAGFIIGAQYGDGALVKRKQGGGYYIDEYFSLAAASYGL